MFKNLEENVLKIHSFDGQTIWLDKHNLIYEVGNFLGGGAAGTVYECEDVKSHENYALKILNPIGYKLTSPAQLRRCTIVLKGKISPEILEKNKDGINIEHVWWLLNESTKQYVSAYFSQRHNSLQELSLVQCFHIWGPNPEGVSEDETGEKDSYKEVYIPTTGRQILLPLVPPKYADFIRRRWRIFNEINNMRKIRHHVNVIRLENVLELTQDSKCTIFLVMELANGGELFDRIKIDCGTKESTAKIFFHQLLLGVRHCHQQGVCHRDLKPENLLLQDVSGSGNNSTVLKIADFGFSARFALGNSIADKAASLSNQMHLAVETLGLEHKMNNSTEDDLKHNNHTVLSARKQHAQQQLQAGAAALRLLKSVVGSPFYVAPEVMQAKGYDGQRADVWSLGVILYAMLAGNLPFEQDLTICKRYKLFCKWVTERSEKNDRFWYESVVDYPEWLFPAKFSSHAKSLITAMLQPEPHLRITISEAMLHPLIVVSSLSREITPTSTTNNKSNTNNENNRIGILHGGGIEGEQGTHLMNSCNTGTALSTISSRPSCENGSDKSNHKSLTPTPTPTMTCSNNVSGKSNHCDETPCVNGLLSQMLQVAASCSSPSPLLHITSQVSVPPSVAATDDENKKHVQPTNLLPAATTVVTVPGTVPVTMTISGLNMITTKTHTNLVINDLGEQRCYDDDTEYMNLDCCDDDDYLDEETGDDCDDQFQLEQDQDDDDDDCARKQQHTNKSISTTNVNLMIIEQNDEEKRDREREKYQNTKNRTQNMTFPMLHKLNSPQSQPIVQSTTTTTSTTTTSFPVPVPDSHITQSLYDPSDIFTDNINMSGSYFSNHILMSRSPAAHNNSNYIFSPPPALDTHILNSLPEMDDLIVSDDSFHSTTSSNSDDDTPRDAFRSLTKDDTYMNTFANATTTVNTTTITKQNLFKDRIHTPTTANTVSTILSSPLSTSSSSSQNIPMSTGTTQLCNNHNGDNHVPPSFHDLVKRSTRFITAVPAYDVLDKVESVLQQYLLQKLDTPIGCIGKIEVNRKIYRIEVWCASDTLGPPVCALQLYQLPPSIAKSFGYLSSAAASPSLSYLSNYMMQVQATPPYLARTPTNSISTCITHYLSGYNPNSAGGGGNTATVTSSSYGFTGINNSGGGSGLRERERSESISSHYSHVSYMYDFESPCRSSPRTSDTQVQTHHDSSCGRDASSNGGGPMLSYSQYPHIQPSQAQIQQSGGGISNSSNQNLLHYISHSTTTPVYSQQTTHQPDLFLAEFIRGQIEIFAFKRFYQLIRHKLSELVKKDYKFQLFEQAGSSPQFDSGFYQRYNHQNS